MPIRLGTSLADTFKVGTNQVSKIYKGSDLAWEPAAVGPSSPITVVEEKFTTFAANGPQSVTFTETPQPGDKILVVYACHRASSIRVISSITGMGAVWSNLVAHTGQISAWIGEDPTSSGVVTITQNSAYFMTAHLYLIRGLTSRAVLSSLINLGGGTLSTPSVDAGWGQIAVSWMGAFDATLADLTRFPGVKTPTTGWDVNDVQHTGVNAFGSAYRTPGEKPKVAHSAQAQIGSGDAGYIGTLVLGDYNYEWADQFNRANNPLGSDWALLSGVALTVASNLASSPDAGTNHMQTVAVASSADQWSQAYMSVAGTLGVGARLTSASETGYLWRYNGTDCQLFRMTAGSFTAIGSAYSAVLAAGACLRIECQGTTIRGLVDGVVRATTTDATHAAAGRGSLRLGGTTVRANNFAMGIL